MTGLLGCVPRRFVAGCAVAGAVLTGGLALTAGAVALVRAGDPAVTGWIAMDAAGGLMVAVIGLVGLISVLCSPAYLSTMRGALLGGRRRETTYFVVLDAFWAVLLAVPLAGNLGVAWLLIEATTAASALLVGFSGKPRALEAG